MLVGLDWRRGGEGPTGWILSGRLRIWGLPGNGGVAPVGVREGFAGVIAVREAGDEVDPSRGSLHPRYFT